MSILLLMNIKKHLFVLVWSLSFLDFLNPILQSSKSNASFGHKKMLGMPMIWNIYGWYEC